MIKVISIVIKRKIRFVLFNKWVGPIFNMQVQESINRETLMALSKPIISSIIKRDT